MAMSIKEAFEQAGIAKPVVKEPAMSADDWKITKEIAAAMGVKL